MHNHDKEMRPRRDRWIRFSAAWGLLGLVWLILLPWIGGQEDMRRHLQRLDRAGVNAGALYYTDLKMLPVLLRRLKDVHRRHPAAFWNPLPPQPLAAEDGEDRERSVQSRHESP